MIKELKKVSILQDSDGKVYGNLAETIWVCDVCNVQCERERIEGSRSISRILVCPECGTRIPFRYGEKKVYLF